MVALIRQLPVFGAFLGLSACTGQVADYSPQACPAVSKSLSKGAVTSESPPCPTGSTLPDISALAADYSNDYATRAGKLANTPQIFEVPAIGGAIGAAAGAVFRASQREIEAFALGGASSLALDQYYDPRDRAQIYAKASSAMHCLSDLAEQTNDVISNDDGAEASVALSSLRAYVAASAAGGTATDAQSAVEAATDLGNHAIFSLNSAIDSVNLAAFTQALNKSTMPDLKNLQSQLTSEVQQSVAQKSAAASALTQQAGGGRAPGSAAETISPADAAHLQDLIDFASDFDGSVTVCTGQITS